MEQQWKKKQIVELARTEEQKLAAVGEGRASEEERELELSPPPIYTTLRELRWRGRQRRALRSRRTPFSASRSQLGQHLPQQMAPKNCHALPRIARGAHLFLDERWPLMQ
jgi:hypothetical protein